jgi:hypothetical protein
MLVRFTKNPPGATADTVTCVQPSGSSTAAAMARNGLLPHEAMHFVIEDFFGWHDAFFGHIARGERIEQVSDRLHRRNPQWSKMTQALHCEALIECLEAEQWGGATDPVEFAQKLVAACRKRGIVPPDITAEELERVRVALREFGAAWRPLAPGASLERTFRT